MDEIDVIIIDSLSHFWVKEGGILEQKNEADKKVVTAIQTGRITLQNSIGC